MKAQLQVTKNSALLHSGVYDIDNADDFGKACADVWFALRERQLNNESSIGALMEHLDRGVFDLLAARRLLSVRSDSRYAIRTSKRQQGANAGSEGSFDRT